MVSREKNALTTELKEDGEKGESLSTAVAPVYNINIINNTGNIAIGDNVTVNISNYTTPVSVKCKSNPTRKDTSAHDGDPVKFRTPEIEKKEAENRKRKLLNNQLQGQQQLQFPQRKKRRDSTHHGGVSRELIFRSTKTQGSRKEMHIIYLAMNSLHPLRESGNWLEFNKALNLLGKNFNANPNRISSIKILSHIERSVALSYQGEFTSAMNSIDRAKILLDDLNSPLTSFLVALLHAHLTSIYRRQNMMEEAHQAIAVAEQNLDSQSENIVRAYVFYEKASNLTKAVSLIPVSDERRNELVQKGNYYLKVCVDVCSEIQDEGSVYVHRHHFALVKMALQKLNCRTRAARSSRISQEDIEEAESCIYNLENKFGKDINGATAIQLHVAKSDLSYRLRDFPNAKKFGYQALEIAKRLGFKLEVEPIQKRLDDFDLIMHALSEFPSLVQDRESDGETSSPFAVDIELLTEKFKKLSIGTQELNSGA